MTTRDDCKRISRDVKGQSSTFSPCHTVVLRVIHHSIRASGFNFKVFGHSHAPDRPVCQMLPAMGLLRDLTNRPGKLRNLGQCRSRRLADGRAYFRPHHGVWASTRRHNEAPRAPVAGVRANLACQCPGSNPHESIQVTANKQFIQRDELLRGSIAAAASKPDTLKLQPLTAHRNPPR